MKSLLHFIQYHNGTVLLVVFLGLGSSVFAATEITKTRTSDVLVSDAEMAETVDVSALLDADLDGFDMKLTILGTEEGETAYAIAYEFRTFSIVEGAWQEVAKTGTLTVEKTSMLGTTLEAYALLELTEVVEQERDYLKRAQAYERTNAEKWKTLRSFSGLSLEALAEKAHTEREVAEPEPETEPVPLEKELEEQTLIDVSVDTLENGTTTLPTLAATTTSTSTADTADTAAVQTVSTTTAETHAVNTITAETPVAVEPEAESADVGTEPDTPDEPVPDPSGDAIVSQ